MAFVGGYHEYVKIKRGDNGIYQRPEMTKRSVNYYSTKVRGRKTHVMATPTMPICFKAAWAWQRSPSVTIWKGRLMSKSGTQGNKLRLTPSFIHLMLGIVPIVIFNSKKFRFGFRRFVTYRFPERGQLALGSEKYPSHSLPSPWSLFVKSFCTTVTHLISKKSMAKPLATDHKKKRTRA